MEIKINGSNNLKLLLSDNCMSCHLRFCVGAHTRTERSQENLEFFLFRRNDRSFN